MNNLYNRNQCVICYKKIKNVTEIKLTLVDDIPLNDKLCINYCSDCVFYFSNSNNTDENYIDYYTNFNNYSQVYSFTDKDQKCYEYINQICKVKNIHTILDYGSGNNELSKLLQSEYEVSQYDIGMEQNANKYDCLILSHVLEHIFNVNDFISQISQNINDDGILYIEVPNADFYDKITDICPLQEINIEHINFFSKTALIKLLTKYDYYCIDIQDDFFNIKNMNYYVIRGIFKKYNACITNSFQTYMNNGLQIINSYNYTNLQAYKSIYVYGCGQFLFKIFDKITEHCTIINIIDDNPCYLNKKIQNAEIIFYMLFLINILRIP